MFQVHRDMLCVQLAFLIIAGFCCRTTTSSINPSNKYFYIYEDDFWPDIAMAAKYKRDINEKIELQLNNGAGPAVDVASGNYHTDQYQLFSMIYHRALKDPRRTLDPSKATSFLIPYDFANDAAFYKDCVKSKGVCFDFRRCPLAPKVEELLNKSPWYNRNHGHDHILIVGMNYAMDHYILKPLCKSLLAGTCRNCTKFAIDDYSFLHSGNEGIDSRGDFWHAAPFPADFHWSREVSGPFPWENTNRTVLVSYIGSDRSFYPPARRLRGSIIHYCRLHPNECTHGSYGFEGTRYSHNIEGHRPLQLAQQSIFCFQPIGDLMTRKGLFDSILQGCIPVVFDVLTASVMYTWHWEESFWNEVVIEYPFHPTAHRYFDPVAALLKLYQNESASIARKQELIRSRVFQLQYGLDGWHDLYQYNSSLKYTMVVPNTTVRETSDQVQYITKGPTSPGRLNESVFNNSTTWPIDSMGNPLRDAFDICIDYCLGWHSGSLTRFRNATVPECWNGWLDKKANKCRPGEEPKQ